VLAMPQTHPPHTTLAAHTLDVASVQVYGCVEEKFDRVDSFTMYGQISWQGTLMLYCATEKAPTGEPFAGAPIGQSGIPGQMWTFIFSTTERTIDVRPVQLAPKHLNSVRDLKTLMPEADSPNT
jgi:hypothetical protein